MKVDIEKARLIEIIEYLEDNPKVECNPYPEYESKVFELLNSLGTERCYMRKYEKIGDKEMSSLSLSEIKTMYTFILRSERFSDGNIKAYIEDETLLKLAKRELELLEV